MQRGVVPGDSRDIGTRTHVDYLIEAGSWAGGSGPAVGRDELVIYKNL